MRNHFPGHRYYFLADDGSFETWIPVDAKNDWAKFAKSELARPTTNRDNDDLP
jgi:hypothetical protein